MKEKKNGKRGRKELESILHRSQDDIQILTIEEEAKESKKPQEKQGKRQKKEKLSNREFARVTYFFVALFLVMMGYIVYFNAVRAKDIINSPYNVRLDSMADRVIRGKILDKDGNVLARTNVSEDGTETREYPYGNLYAHVVGYDAMGKSGLESTANFELLTSNAFFLEKLAKEFQEEKNIGDNIVTTLDTNLQQAAYDALGKYKGAVVVMEASTGKILAMVSKPCFNPNSLVEDWDTLVNTEDGILLNRATQGAYAPGSVFKLVTALGYMRQNPDYEDYSFECSGEYTSEDITIHCAKNRAHGTESFGDSIANSCNASFSNIGLSLDLKQFEDTTKDLLFNSKLPCELPYSKSKYQLQTDDPVSEIMMTSIGQGKTQMSPYHMTLISAAIANGGTLMKPYLVDQVVNYTGTTVEKNLPQTYEKLMSSEEASALKEYMRGVVERGTGTYLSGENYTVAGKTGTAEYSSDKDKSHSWFSGFTNVDDPELVITAVVESADNSGMSAVSIVKKVLNAYYY